MVLKKTLLLLLHSPSTSFFSLLLLRVSSSSGGDGGKILLAPETEKKREKKKKCQNSDQSGNKTKHTHTKKEETQMKKTEKGGLKSNCCARSRCSCSPGAAGNWDTMWNDGGGGGGGGDGGPDRPTDRLALSLSWSVWEGTGQWTQTHKHTPSSRLVVASLTFTFSAKLLRDVFKLSTQTEKHFLLTFFTSWRKKRF